MRGEKLGLSFCFEQLQDFPVFGVPAQRFFGENKISVGDYLEDAAAGFDQLRVNAQFFL